MKWGKTCSLEALREKLPQILRTTDIMRPVTLSEGVVRAGENVIIVNAGEKVIHYGRSGPEPVIQPGEPPVDGDAVGTLQQFLNSFSHSLA
jgi:hypothetical protein